jgi:hypothetical protein
LVIFQSNACLGGLTISPEGETGEGYELFLHQIVGVLLVPARYQFSGRFPNAGFVQNLRIELRGVVQLSEHFRVGAEEHIQGTVHVNGGCEGPQPFDLDHLPAAVRHQNGVA